MNQAGWSLGVVILSVVNKVNMSDTEIEFWKTQITCSWWLDEIT